MKLTQVKTGMQVDEQMLRILTPANKGQLAGAAERLVAAGILSRKEQLAYYREMRIREKVGYRNDMKCSIKRCRNISENWYCSSEHALESPVMKMMKATMEMIQSGQRLSGPIGRLVTEEEDLLKSIRGFGQVS